MSEHQHTHHHHGAPRVRFCSGCAAPLERRSVEGKMLPVCPRCGQVVYADPKLAAGTVIEDGGRILLLRRAISPARGLWTFPGGYVDRGEPVAEAAAREAHEEAGVTVTVGELLGVYSARGRPGGADRLPRPDQSRHTAGRPGGAGAALGRAGINTLGRVGVSEHGHCADRLAADAGRVARDSAASVKFLRARVCRARRALCFSNRHQPVAVRPRRQAAPATARAVRVVSPCTAPSCEPLPFGPVPGRRAAVQLRAARCSLAQVSRRPTERLNTGAPGRESRLSTTK